MNTPSERGMAYDSAKPDHRSPTAAEAGQLNRVVPPLRPEDAVVEPVSPAPATDDVLVSPRSAKDSEDWIEVSVDGIEVEILR